ncbi:MAG: hypothetical protein ACK4QL_10990 [Pseudanabaenaceae cyanobacterium]
MQCSCDWQVGIPLKFVGGVGGRGGEAVAVSGLGEFALGGGTGGRSLQSQHNSKLLGMGLAVGTALEAIPVLPESALLVAVG